MEIPYLRMCHERDRYPDGRVRVIGGYLDQVEAVAKEIGAPLVTGKTARAERERVYEQFRQGALRRIVLSKVGNFAVDQPDADVLVQISGARRTFSRWSAATREEESAHHRKLFLTEQGYSYEVRLPR